MVLTKRFIMYSIQDLKSRLRQYEHKQGAPDFPIRRMLNSAIERQVTEINGGMVHDVLTGLRGGGKDDDLMKEIMKKLQDAEKRKHNIEYIKTKCGLAHDGKVRLPSVLIECRKLGASGDDAVKKFIGTYDENLAKVNQEIKDLLTELNTFNEKQMEQAKKRMRQQRDASAAVPAAAPASSPATDGGCIVM